MRRHTMKHPSGPATIARPMPATNARTKKSSNMMVLLVGFMFVIMMVTVAGMAMVGNRSIRVLHSPVR